MNLQSAKLANNHKIVINGIPPDTIFLRSYGQENFVLLQISTTYKVVK